MEVMREEGFRFSAPWSKKQKTTVPALLLNKKKHFKFLSRVSHFISVKQPVSNSNWALWSDNEEIQKQAR